ncbi:hypothetical protein VTH82DRAFT_2284 [Thermothelomyces myriococcoides]
MDSNIVFTGVLNFNYTPKRPIRRGANHAAVPAAVPPAAPPAAPTPTAVVGFPVPAEATFGPLGAQTHGAEPANLAWGAIDPFPAATNFVPPAAAAAPAAPYFSSSRVPTLSAPLAPVPPSQSRLRQFGCEIHWDLYDEPLELSRLVNEPQNAAVAYPAEALLFQNTTSLISCWMVVGCPHCATRPEAVAATLEIALEMCTIYERVARIIADPEARPAFTGPSVVPPGDPMLPTPPPSPILPLLLRLRRDIGEFESLVECVVILLGPYDPSRATELMNRAKNLWIVVRPEVE